MLTKRLLNMSSNAQENRKANANPSKRFFTETLPRDISLSDCVLDLIDNSVHSLVSSADLDVSQHLFLGTKAARVNASVDVGFTASKFLVHDNCGGISIEDAEDHVFRFGEPASSKAETGLGVYGIGMKRAFFKI